jgi:hypothetical protein
MTVMNNAIPNAETELAIFAISSFQDAFLSHY